MTLQSRIQLTCGILSLLVGAAACSGGLEANGSGPGGGGTTMTTSCTGDPDAPTTCTYWTCMNVPTPYGNKTHCTANPPPGSTQPPGNYTCPATGGGVSCPGPDAGGTGPWNCTANEFSLDCERGGGTGGSGGSSGSGGGSGGGWMCVTNPDGSQTCTNPDCTQLPSGEFGCSNGGSPVPPGSSPPGGWSCTVDEFGHEVCTSPPSGGGGGTSGSGGGGSGGSSGGGIPGFSCSYAMVVFYYNGQGPYVIKVGPAGCTDENRTSSDANFSSTCNGDQYDNNGFVMNRNGTAIAPWTGVPACSTIFNITSTQITAVDPAVQIVFAVAHRGIFPNHFGEYCGGSPITYQCGP